MGGILATRAAPACWVALPSPPPGRHCPFGLWYASPDWCLLVSVGFFLDGSGGEHNSPVLRRCGVGVAVLKPGSSTCLWALGVPLPGQLQTVPRAELYAALYVLQHLDVSVPGPVCLISDSAITVAGLQRIFDDPTAPFPDGPNFDLWFLVRARVCLLCDALFVFSVRKIKSHLIDDPALWLRPAYLPAFGCLRDIVGNHFADLAAGAAAAAHCLPSVHVREYNEDLAQFHAVQLRLFTILKDIILSGPARPRRKSDVLVHRAGLSRLVLQSSHVIRVHRNGLSCVRCFGGVATALKAPMEHFLATPCCPPPAIASSVCMPVRPLPLLTLPDQRVFVGARVMHSSHRLWHYRGLLICSTCGRFAAFRGRTLPAPCVGHRGPYGTHNWNRLLKGLLPRGCPAWPAQAPPHLTGVFFSLHPPAEPSD